MIWIVLGTTILYLIQVIVHLSVDVTSLIKSRTENSICYCQSVLESLRLTGNAPNQCGYNCRCFVPKEDDRLYDVLVRAPTSSEITKEIKKQGLEVFDGNFVVKSGTYDDNNNLEKLSSDFPNTRIVMVLIQSSAFITVLVSPIFASAVVKKWNKDYFQAAISISFYSFLELIDAFELVDEVIDNIDFYIDKKSLVNAILAFVSIAIFTLPLSSFVLAGTDKNWKGRNFSEILKNYKIFTMCLLNIPFICIRIRIVSLYGALDSDNSSLVSFILIFKEMAMIVIAVIEIYVDWKYESEEKSTNKPPPVNRVAPATKASSVSLTEPHS
ncbi:DgyrCDS6871 [Dimorphilus gyrociliatus]|nr:DgyrCDS6871 [Dimorphilus gyrociliatus]